MKHEYNVRPPLGSRRRYDGPYWAKMSSVPFINLFSFFFTIKQIFIVKLERIENIYPFGI